MRENQLCTDAFSVSCSPQALPLDASIVFKVNCQKVVPAYPNHLRHVFKTMSLDGAIKIHNLQSLQKNPKLISKHTSYKHYIILIYSAA